MKPKSLKEIEQELGQWENTDEFQLYSLKMRLENSDNGLMLQLPNPDREAILLARPNGFQLTSSSSDKIRKDFVIKHSDIISIQLLPSFTKDDKPSKSFPYVILSIILFAIIGHNSEGKNISLLWLLSGITFGIVLSLKFKRPDRQNLVFILQENEKQSNLLFSISKAHKQRCTDFFNSNIEDKFSNQSQKTYT